MDFTITFYDILWHRFSILIVDVLRGGGWLACGRPRPHLIV